MEREHIEMVAREAGRSAANDMLDSMEDRIKNAVSDGIETYFKKMKIDNDHFYWIRQKYHNERSSWGIARRVFITLLLVAALGFGGQALYEKAMAKVVQDSEQRAGRT